MPQSDVIQLASLAPGSLVAPGAYREACDGLAESLLTRGYAVIEHQEPVLGLSAAKHQLGCFWTGQLCEKAAVRPVQPRVGVGYEQLADQRELFEHRVGPWLRQDVPLPPLTAATKELDPIARAVLSALCRSSYIRLPGSALLPALDDLPLAPQAWASSSLQCLHYQAGSSGCEAHEDRCLLTLIFAPGEPGLQVQSAAGLWHFVQPRSNQLLVLAGHALEYATCGLIHSSRHRVVLLGAKRQSLAYKLAAQPEETIHLRPALEVAGHQLGTAADRFPQPTTYQQIMARFEATHRTANPQALPAAPAEPAAAGGAAVAGTAAGVRAAAATASVAGGGEPVGGGQPAAKRARQAAAPQLQQGAAAQRIRLRHINGDELLLRALPGEKWSTVARMYCFLTGRAPDETRFVFEGAPCTPDETIERLGLVDGDTVDVFDQQVGD